MGEGSGRGRKATVERAEVREVRIGLANQSQGHKKQKTSWVVQHRERAHGTRFILFFILFLFLHSDSKGSDERVWDLSYSR